MYYRNRMFANMLTRFGKKALILTIALVMTFTSVIGGTLAWLVDTTTPIKNTFTFGDVSIDLTETDPEGDDDPSNNTFEITDSDDDGDFSDDPISKDPLITVKANSENCYVFVKLEATEDFTENMEYTIADGWTQLEGETGVYYRSYEKSATDTEYQVLAGSDSCPKGEVSVKSGITAQDLMAAGEISLTITGYAVQIETGDTDSVANAWAAVSGLDGE